MTISENGLELRHLELVAELASAIGRLPAAPTQDWCEEAARVVREIRPWAIVSVTIAGMESQGEIRYLEATGAVGADSKGRDLGGQPIHPDNISTLGWSLAEGVDQAQVCNLRSLPCAAEWAGSPAARRWARFGVSDLAIAIALAPVPAGVPFRTLVVEIGLCADDRPFSHNELSVLRAVLPLLARRAGLAYGPELTSSLTRLTLREQEVLEHLTIGKSVKEIAEDLGRSPHTVHDHVKSLHRKLGASSRGELIARALGRLGVDLPTPAPPSITRPKIHTEAIRATTRRARVSLLSA